MEDLEIIYSEKGSFSSVYYRGLFGFRSLQNVIDIVVWALAEGNSSFQERKVTLEQLAKLLDMVVFWWIGDSGYRYLRADCSLQGFLDKLPQLCGSGFYRLLFSPDRRLRQVVKLYKGLEDEYSTVRIGTSLA